MKKRVVILGAGITGLFAAYRLTQTGIYDVTVVEKEEYVGGMASTFGHNGYRLDFGPHKIYTQIDGVHAQIAKLLGDELIEVTKKSSIRLTGKFFNYPIDIKSFGLNLNPFAAASFAFGYAKSVFRKTFTEPAENSYEQWLVNRFGECFYNAVFRPYAEKIWGKPEELDAKLARIRVAVPNLGSVLRGLFDKRNKPALNAEKFYYPRNGILSLSLAMKSGIENNGGRILTSTRAGKIRINRDRVESVEVTRAGKDEWLNADFLVSTIPVNELVYALSPSVPADVRKAADSLKFRSLVLVFLAMTGDRILKDNWIFFPEKQYIFNRVSEQKGFSPVMVPAGESVLCAEITCDFNDQRWLSSDEELGKPVICGLEEAGLIDRSRVKEVFSARITNAYPVYRLGFFDKLSTVISHIGKIDNLITNGRQGLFNYNNMDHCVEMGRVCAEHIISGCPKEKFWNVEAGKFDHFRIVD